LAIVLIPNAGLVIDRQQIESFSLPAHAISATHDTFETMGGTALSLNASHHTD
jgi:hypothetical protein